MGAIEEAREACLGGGGCDAVGIGGGGFLGGKGGSFPSFTRGTLALLRSTNGLFDRAEESTIDGTRCNEGWPSSDCEAEAELDEKGFMILPGADCKVMSVNLRIGFGAGGFFGDEGLVGKVLGCAL